MIAIRPVASFDLAPGARFFATVIETTATTPGALTPEQQRVRDAADTQAAIRRGAR